MLQSGSATVVVMNWPTGTSISKVSEKLMSPSPSVVTNVDPRNVSPSPLPEGSQALLEKNSRRNRVLAVLLSVPSMVVLPLVAKVDSLVKSLCRSN